jgi:hypothetical protein
MIITSLPPLACLVMPSNLLVSSRHQLCNYDNIAAMTLDKYCATADMASLLQMIFVRLAKPVSVLSSNNGAKAAKADDNGVTPEDQYVAWAYVGSANFSESAW